jgi:ribosomal protein S18 acetylase RimI-like enzyme
VENEIQIRDLAPGDVDAIVAIAVAAWEPIYRYYRQEMGESLFQTAFPDWRAEKARQVETACRPGARARVCVAEQEGEVVGFATYYANGSGVGEIGNNAVRPDRQGQGIGPQMYAYVFGQLRESGMCYVKVSTGSDPAHAPARGAYRKAGFEIALPEVEYYRAL